MRDLKKENNKVYVMYNKSNGAKIKCKQGYVIDWIARGFEVIEIRDESSSQNLGKLSIDGGN